MSCANVMHVSINEPKEKHLLYLEALLDQFQLLFSICITGKAM